MGTACGSCHIGGSLVEKDRNGIRHSQRPMDLTGGTYNAYDNYVLERYNPTSGLPEHFDNPFNPNAGTSAGFGIAYASWSMPGTFDNKPTATDGSNAVLPSSWVPGAEGWIKGSCSDPGYTNQTDCEAATATWTDHPMVANGMAIDGQMSMPNVREMDCFYCHLEGSNNIVSSVAVQMGYFNAAPSLASGLMNMFTQRYVPGTYVTGEAMPGFEAFGAPATLSGDFLIRLKGEPPSDNCRQCHTPTTMANFSDMFDKFLAAAPMSYEPDSPNASLINGMAMPTYDLSAAFVPSGTSPEVHFNIQNPGMWEYSDGSPANGPFGIFPMALDSTWSMLNADGTYNTGSVAGGTKTAGTGPLYYGGAATNDQNALKKATIPFPRADFFKRGDTWDGTSQDVHYNLGCKGCHFNTETLNADLNQCDPGRGHTRMGGVESGTLAIDTRDTVKRCQDCHLTRQNIDNQGIQDYNAPDPTNAHRSAGLLENVVQSVDTYQGANTSFLGNHLDAIDCSVCHIYKKSMAVRALDSTSGNRYPSLIGFEGDTKGMLAMFTDPMPDGSMKNEYKQWQPLYGWHANHPTGDDKGTRKIIPINMITAQMWDDSATDTVDANGDGGEGVQDVQWDPWIMRDMKVGMNFAAGPFGTIPVGFGNASDGVTGGAYQSAFDADMKFTGAFDWIGVYGGNAMLTNPEQITAYKAYRNAIAGSNGVPAKSWADTELVFFGGNPFQVTHNVVPTSKYVLGKQCSDCHSPDSGFFSGGYDMTGSAVPATADFPKDSGNYSTMMERPVLDYEVTAAMDDLRTGSEAKSKKDGSVLDVEFDTLGCWSNATFFEVGEDMGAAGVCDDGDSDSSDGDAGAAVASAEYGYRQTHDLERSEFLYPVPHGSDFSTYYGLTDYTGNTSFATLEEWVTYLESIGTAPTATISAPTPTLDTDGDLTNDTIAVTVDTPVTLTADSSQTGDFTYTWSCTDGGASVTGASASRTFTVPGTFTLRLSVKNNNTGAVATTYSYVKVAAVEVTSANGLTTTSPAWTYPSGGNPQLNITGVPANTNRLVVIWGDGTRTILKAADGDFDASTISTTNPLLEGHAFQTFGDTTTNFVTEVRAVDYPTGGLLGVVTLDELDESQLDGGSVNTDSVAIDKVRAGGVEITALTGGVTTNVDLVTLVGSRAAGDSVTVTCIDAGDDSDDGIGDEPKWGSVYYQSSTTWSADVQLSADGTNTCTATEGGATASVDLTYTPATAGPGETTFTEIDAATVDAVTTEVVYGNGVDKGEEVILQGIDSTFALASVDDAVTLTGTTTTADVKLQVIVNYSDQAVTLTGFTETEVGSGIYEATITGTSWSVPIGNLGEKTYLSIRSVDSVGNEGPSDYVNIYRKAGY